MIKCDVCGQFIQIRTGGPRYSRFRLFAVKERIPKFRIRGLTITYLQFLIAFDIKSCFIKPFLSHTVHFLIIRGFRIRGLLPERIYRELRGLSVYQRSLNLCIVILTVSKS
jgi:hypothetical protein